MASVIKWNTVITPINISTFEASISSTRTEMNESEEVISTDTYTVPRAKIQTSAQKLAVSQKLWAKREKDVAEKAAVNAFVSVAELACNNYLEAQE